MNTALPLVLVVEDDMALSETFSDMFPMLGYRYLGLHHGPESRAVTLCDCPDILLVDQMLDGPEDGIEFTRALKARGLTCPVIAFSASAHMLEAAEASGLFDATLPKPFDMVTLAALIQRLLTEKE